MLFICFDWTNYNINYFSQCWKLMFALTFYDYSWSAVAVINKVNRNWKINHKYLIKIYIKKLTKKKSIGIADCKLYKKPNYRIL